MVAPCARPSHMSSTCMSHAHAICATAASLPASMRAPQCVAKARSMSHSCRWPILTALGSPVEPLVKIMYASALAASAGATGDGGARGVRCAAAGSERRSYKKGVRKRGVRARSPPLAPILAVAASHVARRESATSTSPIGVASVRRCATRAAGSDESIISHAQPRSRHATIATYESTLRSQRMATTEPGVEAGESSEAETCAACCKSCQ
mmetsp:Transcript_39193/g.126767  ORF Transcript_39193/g.126767 Transcript_39193/m.126767 type:complete len:210 (+) Transcript_39193:4270-4899(+)